MHTEMWEHPATQANVATLRARGALVIEPAEGRLTGSRHRQGPAARARRDLRGLPRGARPRARRTPDLAGRHVVVSAGGTREYLDPVRFLGNRSVRPPGLRPGPRRRRPRAPRSPWSPPTSTLPDPAGVKVVRVETTAELRQEVVARRRRRRRGGDGRRAGRLPARPTSSDAKIKKAADGSAPGHRADRRTPTSSREIAHRPRPRRARSIVGFAAETGDAHRLGARPGPRQAGPQGLRPARRQRRQRRQRSSAAPTTRP